VGLFGVQRRASAANSASSGSSALRFGRPYRGPDLVSITETYTFRSLGRVDDGERLRCTVATGTALSSPRIPATNQLPSRV
jgi:hypothetical protein